MATIVKCDVCDEVAPVLKASHAVNADDDRFFVRIEVRPQGADLDTCIECWWNLVRAALRETMKEPVA